MSPRTTIAARLQLIVGMSPGIIEHRAPVRKELISIFNFVAMAMLMKEFCQRQKRFKPHCNCSIADACLRKSSPQIRIARNWPALTDIARYRKISKILTRY